MNRRVINIVVSVIVAGLFIWLAVRNVELGEVWEQVQSVSLYWLPLFLGVLLFSHFLRAERWRLLLLEENQNIPRSTLFAGVMFGYFMNNLVPRLGEVSRPVYVAKKRGLSSSKLLGTIVLERIIDVCTMLLLLVLIAFYLSREFAILEGMLGIGEWSAAMYLIIPGIVLLLIVGAWLFYKVLLVMERKEVIQNRFLLKVLHAGKSFGEGVISIRHVKNWPLFLILTAGIWIGYILMTYIPFYMMDLQAVFALGLEDAVVLTIVSSVGVSIPTPAGIGSYHLLIQQSMNLLYEVPLATALTYATIAHASTVLLIFAVTPISLWWDKYNTLKSDGDR